MTEKALSIIIQREDLPQLFGKRVDSKAAIEEIVSKEDSKPTSESPFHEVLSQWGEDFIEQEKNLPEAFEAVILGRSFTLKNGIQVKVEIGRDIIEED